MRRDGETDLMMTYQAMVLEFDCTACRKNEK